MFVCFFLLPFRSYSAFVEINESGCFQPPPTAILLSGGPLPASWLITIYREAIAQSTWFLVLSPDLEGDPRRPLPLPLSHIPSSHSPPPSARHARSCLGGLNRRQKKERRTFVKLVLVLVPTPCMITWERGRSLVFFPSQSQFNITSEDLWNFLFLALIIWFGASACRLCMLGSLPSIIPSFP